MPMCGIIKVLHYIKGLVEHNLENPGRKAGVYLLIMKAFPESSISTIAVALFPLWQKQEIV